MMYLYVKYNMIATRNYAIFTTGTDPY